MSTDMKIAATLFIAWYVVAGLANGAAKTNTSPDTVAGMLLASFCIWVATVVYAVYAIWS